MANVAVLFCKKIQDHSCMKLAMETADCPIDFENLQFTLEKKFGCEVVLGTHSY